jgi:hypothetical protein
MIQMIEQVSIGVILAWYCQIDYVLLRMILTSLQ